MHRRQHRNRIAALGLVVVAATLAIASSRAGSAPPLFTASDRCLACHNGLTTALGEDVSIGFAWRASIMANAARDPYGQAAVRREIVDHPDASPVIQDECAACHMPMARFEARAAGRKAEVFSRLGGGAREGGADRLAIDGGSGSLCPHLQ